MRKPLIQFLDHSEHSETFVVFISRDVKDSQDHVHFDSVIAKD